MSCLGWIKRRRCKSGRRGSASGPAATTTTTMTTASAVSTSRSDDSSGPAGRPASKSTGSAASSQPSISSLYEERGHGQLRAFDYEELRGATNDFGRAQKLGEGGFGGVYKGFVRPHDAGNGNGNGKGDSRIAVAVKRLNQRGLQVRLLHPRPWHPWRVNSPFCSALFFLPLRFSIHSCRCSRSGKRCFTE
jgi:hypothetical protein